MSAGVATGAALGGMTVDGMASMGGFALVVVFGVLLVVGAALVRTPAPVAQELLDAPAR
jgi:predicted MFS family arabinose efflux permease